MRALGRRLAEALQQPRRDDTSISTSSSVSADPSAPVIPLSCPAYEYEDLTEVNDFRLLELLPGERFESIHCRLKPASLAAQPLYTALSYTWGESSVGTVIYINDSYIMARRNLYHALRDLRHRHHSQTYWVDAICIDQTNNTERSAQVRRMAAIYRTAVVVVAWLRDVPCMGAADNHPIPKQTKPRYMLSDALSKLQSQSLPEISDVLAAFFNHEYWTRRWIVQELALAKSAQICCGSTTISLADVKSLLRKQTTDRHGDSLAARICQLQESGSGANLTLEKALSDYASTNCREYLDKVYALVSMSKKAREFLVVSYDISITELLLRTVEFCCLHEDLPPGRTIGFALALADQLSIRARNLALPTGWQYPRFDGGNTLYGFNIHSNLNKRGVVTASVVDAGVFHSVQSLREICPAVGHHDFHLLFRFENLMRLVTTHPVWHVVIRGSNFANVGDDHLWSDYEIRTVSPRDLFAFTWQPRQGVEKGGSNFVWIGFASARVEPGDYVCQFSGTRISTILRRRPGSEDLYVVCCARLAWIATRGSSLLSELYNPSPHEKEDYFPLMTKGWRTHDLIRLAYDDIYLGRHGEEYDDRRKIGGKQSIHPQQSTDAL